VSLPSTLAPLQPNEPRPTPFTVNVPLPMERFALITNMVGTANLPSMPNASVEPLYCADLTAAGPLR
jgi:hypothetical protein